MSIDTRGAEYAKHIELFKLPKALLEGTEAMRGDDDFLPKRPRESLDDYQYRKKLGVVNPGYYRVLNFLTGQIFKSEPRLEGEQDQSLKDFTENVDKNGNSLSVFAQNCFRLGLHAGMSFILVDHDAVETKQGASGPEYFDRRTGAWKPRTVAARQENGWGPYWVLVRGENVIDAWFEFVGGKARFTHFRFEEYVDELKDDGLTKESIQQIRVLEPGVWKVYRKSKGVTGKESWEVHSEGQTTMHEIPVAPFIPGDELGKFAGQPALKVLAELCLDHWRADIQHKLMMDFARAPVMHGKCLSHEDGFVIPAAPGMGIHSTDPNSDLKSVNVIPEGMVAQSREDLKEIEAKIASFGLQLMAPRSGNLTAAQVRRESSETDSALQRWAELFRDTLENALRFTAMWLGKEIVKPAGGPAVTVNKDFDDYIDQTEVDALFGAVDRQIVSKETAYETLRGKGTIKTGREWKEEQALIENDNRMTRLGSPVSAQEIAEARLGPIQAQG